MLILRLYHQKSVHVIIVFSTMSFPETHSPNLNPNLTPWTIVSTRKNRKNPKRTPYPNPNSHPLLPQIPTPTPWAPSDLNSEPDPLRHSKLRNAIQSSLDRLTASKFSRHFLSQLRSPEIQFPLADLGLRFHLVIYGIGSVESFATPRLQLSLAVLLLRELGPSILSVEAFDPVLTSAECAAIEDLGISIFRIDESGRREVKAPTLFFMPHCEIELYNNLLDANWGEGGLRKVAILGNSFGGYKRSADGFKGYSPVTKDMGRRVMAAARFAREVEIDGAGWEGHGFYEAFHNMSWHFFGEDDGGDIELNIDFRTE